MSEREGAAAAMPNVGYEGLRELLAQFEEMGELERVEGADWNLEIGALSETVAGRNPGRAPALLFDKIPGYPEGFRVLSGAANAYRRLAVVLGLPDPSNEMDLVQENVNGTVRLKLYKGAVAVAGRRSDSSLYDPSVATFEADDVYNQADADGFIKLNALRLRLGRGRLGVRHE